MRINAFSRLSVKARNSYDRFILWRKANISQKNFTVLLALIVGVLTALAAVLLKHVIHFIANLLTGTIHSADDGWLLLIFPAVGIAIAALFVHFVVRDDISHGITKVLYSISQRKARIKPHNTWSSLAASSVTIGFGGSVGAEAPIVLTGSAIGSSLGQFFKLDRKTMMLLVGCGASGAIGGIFNAPIAGLVFTLEVLMLDATATSIIPLLISSVTATSVSYFLMGSETMFHFEGFSPFALNRIPWLIVLGVVCGFVSLYFVRGIARCEKFFHNIKSPYIRLGIGGATLSLLIFFLPSLYGEGYSTISALLSGTPQSILADSPFFELYNGNEVLRPEWIFFIYVALTMFLKIVATAATNGAGGTGGTFAPSLFVGCLTGYLVAFLCNYFGVSVPERNFAFAGMAGVMSAVMHAPLTGIFLIAEITGGYGLFMSLMITSVTAYITIMFFEPHGLYARRLARRGELLTHHKDKAVLTILSMKKVIETDLLTVTPEMTLGEFTQVLVKSKRNVFPVVDRHRKYVGSVQIDEIRNIIFRRELYDRFKVERFMTAPPGILHIDDSMEKAMDIFDKTGAWNLPVVDAEGRYLGYISKSRIFNNYRNVLVKYSDD